MRNILLGLLLLALAPASRGQDNTDRLLNELNAAIDAAPKYDDEKIRMIDELKSSLKGRPNEGLQAQFHTYLRLYEEYKVFNYDSAFGYAKRLQETALRIGDPIPIMLARLKLGFCLLSSGMFKETLDSLNKINTGGAPDSIRAAYYALTGRFYYDLGDFDNDSYYTPAYTEKGNRYMDSALLLYPPASFEYAYYKGLKEIKSGNRDLALTDFRKLIDRPGLSLHELALTASTLSDIYIYNGRNDTAIRLLIRAAIADIRSSTKETAAIFNLAQLLYKQGDVKNASSYIEAAIRNASFYGARQRKVQVSAILPLIEGEKITRVESQKKILVTYAAVTTGLLLLVVVLALIIFRQVSKLKAAQKIITEAHVKELAINQRLVETNYKLSEANKIKEEYIGYFFNTNSEFFAKIEKFKKSLEQKLAYRKWEDIISLVNNINLKKEKEELLQNFDKVFLKLFPDFVKGYNTLFLEEDRAQLRDHEFLNTDLRIFALIRMGIHENEKIARILEYSVNTINTYKTRIKNKSTVPNEDFEHRIMEIKTL
jgi:tetratricopeptide (TPR) repeat protein